MCTEIRVLYILRRMRLEQGALTTSWHECAWRGAWLGGAPDRCIGPDQRHQSDIKGTHTMRTGNVANSQIIKVLSFQKAYSVSAHRIPYHIKTES